MYHKHRLPIFLLTAVLALSLAGCGAPAADSQPPVMVTPGHEPAPLPDLSAYDAHGQWDYMLAWVHKTQTDGGYYGYLHMDGSIVGGWHPDTQWLQPAEHRYGLAPVCTGIEIFDDHSLVSYSIYGTDGSRLLQFTAHSYETTTPAEKYQNSLQQTDSDWPWFSKDGLLLYTAADDGAIKPVYLVQAQSETALQQTLISQSTRTQLYPQYFDARFIEDHLMYRDYATNTVLYIARDGSTALDLTGFEHPIVEAWPLLDGVAHIIYRDETGQRYLIGIGTDGSRTQPQLLEQ